MKCRDAQPLLSAYIDRQLPAWEKDLVSEHTDSCRPCQTEVQSLLDLKRVLRAQTMPGLPAEVRSAIQAQTVQKVSRWREFISARWWLPPVAIATAVGGWLVARHALAPVQIPESLVARRAVPTPSQEVVSWRADPQLSSSKNTQ